MATSNLPTGQEPPKGYEKLIEDLGREQAEIRVDRVAASQLSSIEVRELERIRGEAIERIRETVGNRGFEITFDHEMNLWPEGKTPTDKLLFRAYIEGVLAGYALVVRGWPGPDAWAIQHLIIDPDMRLRGVGRSIVEAIEGDALATSPTTVRIVSVPLASANNSFWEFMGYRDAGVATVRTTGGLEFAPDTYEKAVR